MKAIVTGGMGFIGNAVVNRLLSMGWDVIIIENFEGGFMRKIQGGVNSQVRVINLDVCQLDEHKYQYAEANGADVFFHFAAHYANEKSLKEPMSSVGINVTGTMACLEFARHWKIPTFVYASTSGVYGGYGNSTVNPVYAEDSPPAPNTPYEVSKYSGELLALGYSDIYGMRVVCPRFFNVYGVGDIPGRWRAVIPNFFRSALADEDLVVTGATGSRDFTYISNVVDGILAGLNYVTAEGNPPRLVYNIATGKEVFISELAKLIVQYTKSSSGIQVTNRRNWDNAERRVGDVTRFASLFPELYNSMHDIERGLSISYSWYTDTCKKGVC